MDEITTTNSSVPFDSQISIDESAPMPKGYKIHFKGSAKEYFKIWIVNIALIFITLGIYSAWAKVRKKKYFYRNTEFFNETFDYHAEPIKILKGRLIMGALALLYFLGGKISVYIPIVAGLIFFIALPWIIVQGRLFNLRNTSYRNIRFDFERNYKGCYITFFKGYFVAAISLGLAFPYAIYLQARFLLSNSLWGQSRFDFSGRAGPVFGYIYASGLFSIIGFSVLMGFIFIFKKSPIAMGFGVIFFYLMIFAGGAYSRAKYLNYIYSNVSNGSIKLYSDLDWTKMVELYITNFIAIVLTLGLATPWAEIRTLRYRLSEMRVIVPDEAALQNFIQVRSEESSSAGDAAADLWDVDLGF